MLHFAQILGGKVLVFCFGLTWLFVGFLLLFFSSIQKCIEIKHTLCFSFNSLYAFFHSFPFENITEMVKICLKSSYWFLKFSIYSLVSHIRIFHPLAVIKEVWFLCCSKLLYLSSLLMFYSLYCVRNYTLFNIKFTFKILNNICVFFVRFF